jgi:ABC-type transport system involved in multi-copper enzyme maturation permease subunit
LGRWEFITGKFLGLSLGLCTGQILMLLIGILYLWVTGFPMTMAMGWYFILAGLLIMVEVIIMAAVSLMFTVVSSPLLAAVLSLVVYMLGHAVATLPQLMNHLDYWQQWIAGIMASLIPNLGHYTYRNQAVHGYPPDYADLGVSLIYAALWIVLLLTLTIIVFRRRQL